MCCRFRSLAALLLVPFLLLPIYLSQTQHRVQTANRLVDIQASAGGGATPNVPFWVYEGPEFLVFQSCKIELTRHPNHIGELYFLQSIENHPWRVRDPHGAAVFIVPLPLSAINRGACRRRVTEEDLNRAVEVIRNSWQFQRNKGWDHLLVGTDWHVQQRMPPALRTISLNFAVAHKGSFARAPWRCTINAPHSSHGNADFPLLQQLHEFISTRNFTFFFQGQTERNPGYAIRRKAMQQLPGFHSPNIIVSSSKTDAYKNCTVSDLEGCVQKTGSDVFHQRLRLAKFNLFLRGDDLASARMYDAMWEGTPNIVFSDQIWTRGLPSQCQVPWEQLVFRGSEAAFLKDPRAELGRLYETVTDEDIKVRLNALRVYAADVLWDVAGTRLPMNIIYNTARKCIPHKILKAAGVDPIQLKCQFHDPSVTRVYGSFFDQLKSKLVWWQR